MDCRLSRLDLYILEHRVRSFLETTFTHSTELRIVVYCDINYYDRYTLFYLCLPISCRLNIYIYVLYVYITYIFRNIINDKRVLFTLLYSYVLCHVEIQLFFICQLNKKKIQVYAYKNNIFVFQATAWEEPSEHLILDS